MLGNGLGLNRLINQRSDLPVTPLGTIFSDTFDRGTLGGNYTEVGSPTVVMDGNNLVLSGGAGTYAKYVRYSAWNTCLEKWQIVLNFQATTASASSEGIFVGIKTSSAFGNRSVIGQFNSGGGINKGKSFILAGSSAPDNFSILQTSTAQTINVNDEVKLTVTRDGLGITFLTENITTGTSKLLTHNFPLTLGSTTYQHNTGTPYVGTIGGTQTIRDWTFTSLENKNIKTMFVGDSITHGLSASVLTNRWANRLMTSSTNAWNVNAGGGDYTANTLAKINELILVKPRYAVLQVGGNDVRFGVAAGTRQANYTSIVSQLTAAGITVIHALATPDNTTNMTTWNSWLSSNYTTIDCFTPLKNGGTGLNAAYDASDGTHLNNAGHQLNADTIAAAAPQII